jgi:hypothetical protein
MFGGDRRYGMDGWTCSLILEVSDVLDIFFEYSLKIPQICSNILDISLSGGRGGLTGEAGG